MPKIVFIGAGSFGFTRGLVRDLLTFPLLEGSEIALVDINKERLDFARRACQKIIDGGNYRAKLTATTDRREVLKGARRALRDRSGGAVGTTAALRHDARVPEPLCGARRPHPPHRERACRERLRP